jgi:hypothetical protein
MKKKKQDKNKSLTGNPDLDSKPWIPANSIDYLFIEVATHFFSQE